MSGAGNLNDFNAEVRAVGESNENSENPRSNAHIENKKHIRFYSLDYRDRNPLADVFSEIKEEAAENEDKISENLREKSTQNCLICFDNQPDAVFMDCGHGGVCYDCSLDLWKRTGDCFLCRNVGKKYFFSNKKALFKYFKKL